MVNEVFMGKVAILYICTGKYTVFWPEFFSSYEKNFLKKSEVHYYVFTDADKLEGEETGRVHKKFQKKLGWPNDTLMRFHMFKTIEDELKSYDFIYFMNANCECVAPVTEEEFLPQDKNLVVVKHPGFYNKTPLEFTYDRNPKSTAYIPEGEGNVYVCGGINGGTSSAFIELIDTLVHNIDEDKKNGIIALWHDESHINHYILNRHDYRLLSPSYCFAEGWDLPFEPKIVVREKSRYIDVDLVKKEKGIKGWLLWMLQKIR